MIDSGLTVHMTPLSETLDFKENCNMKIALDDDSNVTATEKGVRKYVGKGKAKWTFPSVTHSSIKMCP